MIHCVKSWSNESASHHKLTCGDLRWHQWNGCTSRHKFCTFAIYSLTFLILRWYTDSPLKRCLKDTSINLCISEFDHFFFFSIWPSPVWLSCFRDCECCFDSKQHQLHPRPPCLILIQQTSIDLCMFCVETNRKSSQVRRNLRWNLKQASASYRKLAAKRRTS